MSWKILDPVGGTYQGEISPLTKADCKSLRPIRVSEKGIDGWFDWADFMHKNLQYEYYKLERADVPGILGAIALEFNDGVYVASLETHMGSRHMDKQHKQYVNLAPILISFATLWGIKHYNDGFVYLHPKGNLKSYYMHKYGAQPSGGVYALNEAVINNMIRLYYY